MQNIGAQHEIIKKLKHNEYTKQGYLVVDDLLILSLPECKNSLLELLIVCPDMIESNEAKSVLKYYQDNCPTYAISKKTFETLASKQNCVGMILVTKLSDKLPEIGKDSLIVVCDGLETHGNIGTIFRTLDACKASCILFCNQQAKVNDINVIRASRGTVFTVPYKVFDDVKSCVDYLNGINSRILICEPEQGENYNKINYCGTVAIVVGSERYGVSKEWFTLPNTEFIKIPMKSNVGSLNVGVATSIIAYQVQTDKKIL